MYRNLVWSWDQTCDWQGMIKVHNPDNPWQGLIIYPYLRRRCSIIYSLQFKSNPNRFNCSNARINWIDHKDLIKEPIPLFRQGLFEL
jgi:hypothetical protein